MGVLRWFLGPPATASGRGERSRLTRAAGPTPAWPLARGPADVASLLCAALRPLLMQSAARGIALLIWPASDFPREVRVDALKLTWAVSALVGNALRFTRPGTRLRPGGTIRVRMAWQPESREAVFSVSDDADGIPPDRMEGLLSRDTTPGVVPSLALLLVEDIVHAHGGTFEVESVHGGPESGTTVSLRIPCPEG